MKFGWMRLALGTALVGATVSAQALELSLTGFSKGSQTVNIIAPGKLPNQNPASGQFQGTLSGAAPFDAKPFYTYCVQLAQTFSWGSLLNYSVASGLDYFTNVNPAVTKDAHEVVDRLARLFTVANGMVLADDTQTSAAMQIAVWESIYEGASGFNDFGNGSFKVGTNPPASTVDEAKGLLTSAMALTASEIKYSISVLHSTTQQDFLLLQRSATPSNTTDVPEPSSWALAGLALAGLGVARRRRA